MDQNRQIRFELSDELYTRIKNNCEEGEMSEFIREAITEKLSRKKVADDAGLEVLQFMKKMDPESILRKLVDQELVSQFTYEEIKKQNEALKLILRRSTFSSSFSAAVLKIHDADLKTRTEKATEEIINTNLDKLGWGGQQTK
jgi:Arc/MetJ-type ribon-helix-helix transcriptional regulator